MDPVWTDGDGLALMELGGYRFMLQNYFVKEWAENFMLTIVVNDATAWHERVSSSLAGGQFGDARVAEPKHRGVGRDRDLRMGSLRRAAALHPVRRLLTVWSHAQRHGNCGRGGPWLSPRYPDTSERYRVVVPSVMIFDDHDMIDDWNISESWARTHAQPWWAEHVDAALMTYWIYQHLGNLSPEAIRQEGILAAVSEQPDGTAALRAWADRAETNAGGPDSYRFSFVRDLGAVRLVMIDVRHARVLTPGRRRMIVEHEWQWIREQCKDRVEHLLIGSSLPVFVPPGLHDLQLWNEALADGKWGHSVARRAEWIRRTLDLEDWPSFAASFDSFVQLLYEVGGQPA